ncbi:MAG: hypothetical protein ACXVCP_10450 [Bdellovibrio sp.]
MVKALRFLIMFALSFAVMSNASFAYGFTYGQCLLEKKDRSNNKLKDTFNTELGEYKIVAKAKAEIKTVAYRLNPDSLKWSYDTTRFVYDLLVLNADLVRLNEIYKIIKTQSPENIKKIQEFFDGSSGHQALADIDDSETQKAEKNVGNLIKLLGQLTEGNPLAEKDISFLSRTLDTERGRDALGDLYDKIQEASVGATPVEPDTIDQWIELSNLFIAGLAPKDCAKCLEAESQFNQLKIEWTKSAEFPEENDFAGLAIKLPPLARMKYPRLGQSAKLAQKVVDYQYLRTMENYLFSRSSITQADVAAWVKVGKTVKDIWPYANAAKAVQGETNSTVKLYKYIQSKERVYNNAFDHFVWGQEGTPFEKSVDGVARTLFGEAESCQAGGASQFEAIASIVAARSISVDLQNQDNDIYLAVANYGISVINLLPFVDFAPLTSYKSGASDFGRTIELKANPLVSEMATPAQVVSKPGQFAVWKIGDVESIQISKLINFHPSLGYPLDMKTTIAGPLGKGMDPAQQKVLCPNGEGSTSSNSTFKEAVKIAEEMVKNYSSFAQRYRFYQGANRVVPYFYTHGANTTLTFVRQIPRPVFMDGSARLEIYKGPGACPYMKFYQPKSLKLVSTKKRR